MTMIPTTVMKMIDVSRDTMPVVVPETRHYSDETFFAAANSTTCSSLARFCDIAQLKTEQPQKHMLKVRIDQVGMVSQPEWIVDDIRLYVIRDLS